jgi:dTDP-4-dehydrorhamnose reductase
MLDCEKIKTVFGITPSDWRAELQRVLGVLAKPVAAV